MYTTPRSLAELLELGQTLRDPQTSTPSLYAQAAEDLLRIRDRNGNESPLILNQAQTAFERSRGGHNIVLKARQMGISTWVAGRFLLNTLSARGVLTVQVAQTREAAESIFRMVQRMFDCLPDDLRKELRRSRSNVGQMVFGALDSEFRILSASDRNAGRGLTIQNLHCSELSRWPGDASATLAGLRAALIPRGELVMESTPNGASGCFYDEWRRAPETGVRRHFMPWWEETAYVSYPVAEQDLHEDERALMERYGLTTSQIGYRRGLEGSYRGLRAQEFAEDAETCFRVSGECCFELDPIFKRLEELGPPTETRRNGQLHLWGPPQPGRRYVVAADPAGGGADGDYSAVQVIDLHTGLQCAELREHLSPFDLARSCAALAREYNGALLVIERNNHGSGVLAHLAGGARYENLYVQGEVSGWLTSSASKPEIVSRLGALLVERPGIFQSARLLEECRTFVTLPGGGMGAAGGAHDDLLMAMAIAQGVRHEILPHTPAPGGVL
ncbi:MAG: terminase [Acidobacteriota bacterium]|nr:terminase [Acidobacteriota bacterium]